jgi:carbon storage regulator
MLILSRHAGDFIVIDGGVTIRVMAVKGNVLRLGIEAPKEVPIHRSEICQRIGESASDLPVPQHSQRVIHGGPQ